jgi:transcriptional regulator with XRE-family HTH domain
MCIKHAHAKGEAVARGVTLNRKRLRGLRQAKLLSQAELAKRAGLSYPTVNRAENGYVATYETVEKLAEVLGVDPVWLLEKPPVDVLIENSGRKESVAAG